jgi:TonB family protein
MPEDILVVEYEPRYTDRVRQALAGQRFHPSFARDGEEAIRALEGQAPRLIVLASVVPKVSTPDLIRTIRAREATQKTPILITLSGYTGTNSRQDAQRMGASDILPKPYTESDFLRKIHEVLGIPWQAAASNATAITPDPEFLVRPSPVPGSSDEAGQLTSNEIFGDLLDEGSAAPAGARKAMKPQDDLDKMLADTLSGVRPQKKKEGAATPAAPADAAKPAVPGQKSSAGQAGLDKLLSDTLSGLEKPRRTPTMPGTTPTPTGTSPGTTPLPSTAPGTTPVPPAAAKTVTPPPMPAMAPPPKPIPTAPPPPPRPAPIAPPAPAAVVPPPAMPEPEPTQKIAMFEQMAISAPVFPKAVPDTHIEEDEPSDGTKFGQYVLLEKIAAGGMAEVWKARMRGVEGFQKIVAIKKILPHLSDNQDFIEMFVDEAKLAAQLNHNNIIHIYDLGKIQSSYYIAMEYVDGHDLKTILRRGEERDQPMQVELALFIASKVAAALDYAHRKHDFEGKDLGLVHRDVSPQNVLVSQDGDIKLCDFGIAKAASKANHTQAGALKGKLQYMSPEQAWGRNIDKRSDIFALATVLFELLTGKKLFNGDSELSILEQVREARVTAPSKLNDEVPPEVDTIVLKALQKDPAARYQTAGEMAKDLDAVLYSIRPTPTSADLAIYMHRIWTDEAFVPQLHDQHREAEPEPQSPYELKVAPSAKAAAPRPVPAAAAAAVVAPVIAAQPHPTAPPMPAWTDASPAAAVPPAKKAPVVPIAIAAVVVLGAIGGYFAMRKPAAGPAPTSATVARLTPPATTSSSVAPLAASTTSSATSATVAPVTGTQPLTLDQAKINEEVQKRLAAERAKLDQTRAQQTTPAPAPPVSRPAPPPTATQAAATPPPVAAPVTMTQPPSPAPAEETRTSAPAEASPARAQTGDLVPQGSSGLTPAHMQRQAPAPYPPMAKMQKIQGNVVVSVLVSETGSVIDTRIISGVNRPGGLNEAALDSIRRSTFTPGMKDGVRVKSWTTVSVNFRL